MKVPTVRNDATAAPRVSPTTSRSLRVPVLWICRVGVAVTWVYNGFWLKLLDDGGSHTRVFPKRSAYRLIVRTP